MSPTHNDQVIDKLNHIGEFLRKHDKSDDDNFKRLEAKVEKIDDRMGNLERKTVTLDTKMAGATALSTLIVPCLVVFFLEWWLG